MKTPRVVWSASVLTFVTWMLFSASLPAHADTVDPVFSRMVGCWHGEGLRTAFPSGRQTKVTNDVVSRIAEDGRFESFNHIVDSIGRTLRHHYWMAHRADIAEDVYELIDERGLRAGGKYIADENSFEVTQVFAADGSLIIVSRTTFATDGNSSDYTERLILQDRVASETHMRFERRPCP